ncbi:DUF1802 family protein [Phormidium sp. LEGE 05292]|uniref:DUF1802 family protein n=1 Tax=[Phormidium] sp. LEGE 05292 TaxID=767427 RepID=UPI00187F94A8|nr:DUF1802 family protein [Phormidium sp. LEGE 05292]MBE9227317.1 DUF1802 family protein [Phormidium sp. LEGE 05292]
MELTIINHALKEWAVAVDALEAGKTILLLRKGGIKEEGNHFKVAHNEVLLYPTLEHQNPDLLKPEYADQVTPVPSGWHPETIRIGAWAKVTDIFMVSFEPSIKALLPFHVWNEQFVSDRLKWKPRQPIYILLLRTYKLSQPQEIPYCAEYSGCKSWIDLKEGISVANATPVLTDAEYNKRTSVIRNSIANPSAANILN